MAVSRKQTVGQQQVDAMTIAQHVSVPRASDVLELLSSVKTFANLRFAVTKEKQGQQAQGLGSDAGAGAHVFTVTKDCSQRPKLLSSLCNIANVLIDDAKKKKTYQSVCKQVGDSPYWQICVQRVHPFTHKDSWPTVARHAQNIVLVARRDSDIEFAKSRKVFVQKEVGRSLSIEDAFMKLVHVPAGAAWGVMPAWCKTTGDAMYADTNCHDNYIISTSAPFVGIIAQASLNSLSSYGFKMAQECGLSMRLPVRGQCSDHSLGKGDLIKMACAKLRVIEEDERPGRAERQRKLDEAVKAKEAKRKQSQYCERCSCCNCAKKRRVDP
jgi:hypothetical protein